MCAAARATVVRPDFHWLAQGLKRELGKLRQFVEEQHTTMRQ